MQVASPPPAPGPQSSKPNSNLSLAYSGFVAASLGFAAAALAAPELLVAFASGHAASGLEVDFTRIAGGTMLLSAAVEYSLKVSRRNRIGV